MNALDKHIISQLNALSKDGRDQAMKILSAPVKKKSDMTAEERMIKSLFPYKKKKINKSNKIAMDKMFKALFT